MSEDNNPKKKILLEAPHDDDPRRETDLGLVKAGDTPLLLSAGENEENKNYFNNFESDFEYENTAREKERERKKSRPWYLRDSAGRNVVQYEEHFPREEQEGRF